jgi:hypothetical protein
MNIKRWILITLPVVSFAVYKTAISGNELLTKALLVVIAGVMILALKYA